MAKKAKKAKWVEIADGKVQHIWKCEEGKCEPSSVNPDYYQDNGTPMCECDRDMIYDHTEIKVE